MSIYKVTINLISIVYEIEASTEGKAVDVAKDLLYDEPVNALIEDATYDVEEIK